LFFFCKKRTKKTFALRRGRWAAGGSPCDFAGASAGGPTPASQGESFCALFSKKRCLFVSLLFFD
jgi:hypothetical protein